MTARLERVLLRSGQRAGDNHAASICELNGNTYSHTCKRWFQLGSLINEKNLHDLQSTSPVTILSVHIQVFSYNPLTLISSTSLCKWGLFNLILLILYSIYILSWTNWCKFFVSLNYKKKKIRSTLSAKNMNNVKHNNPIFIVICGFMGSFASSVLGRFHPDVVIWI